jgi:hypothetical protein
MTSMATSSMRGGCDEVVHHRLTDDGRIVGTHCGSQLLKAVVDQLIALLDQSIGVAKERRTFGYLDGPGVRATSGNAPRGSGRDVDLRLLAGTARTGGGWPAKQTTRIGAGSELEIYTDAGHGGAFQRHDAFVTRVLQFLGRLIQQPEQEQEPS